MPPRAPALVLGAKVAWIGTDLDLHHPPTGAAYPGHHPWRLSLTHNLPVVEMDAKDWTGVHQRATQEKSNMAMECMHHIRCHRIPAAPLHKTT